MLEWNQEMSEASANLGTARNCQATPAAMELSTNPKLCSVRRCALACRLQQQSYVHMLHTLMSITTAELCAYASYIDLEKAQKWELLED